MSELGALTRAEFDDGCPYEYLGVSLCEDESGSYVYGYGHVEPVLFAAAVNQFDDDMGAGVDPEDRYSEESVQHRWAETVKPAGDPSGWWIALSANDPDAPNAFPLTVIPR